MQTDELEVLRGNTLIRMPMTTRYARSWHSRLRGLLGTSYEESRSAQLILEPCRLIHTHGMRYSLDVAFIDRQGVVLGTIQQVEPGHTFAGPAGTHAVIERPTQRSAWLCRGDRIVLERAMKRPVIGEDWR